MAQTLGASTSDKIYYVNKPGHCAELGTSAKNRDNSACDSSAEASEDSDSDEPPGSPGFAVLPVLAAILAIFLIWAWCVASVDDWGVTLTYLSSSFFFACLGENGLELVFLAPAIATGCISFGGNIGVSEQYKAAPTVVSIIGVVSGCLAIHGAIACLHKHVALRERY